MKIDEESNQSVWNAFPPVSNREILCCFSRKEIDKFWDGMQPSSIAGLRLNWEAPPHDAGEWLALLQELQPEVILGAWQLPRIPDEFLQSNRGFRYLCYFCGSVRAKISRSFLEQGGIVTNWGGGAARTVAECALMLVLGSLRRVTRYALDMHVKLVWRDDRCEPFPASLFGKSVGIHGFGEVARWLRILLSPFGCRIEYYSKGVPSEVYEKYGASAVESLDSLFAGNDVVIEAEALTPETRHRVDAETLGLLKPGAVFVNVGRGEVLAPGAIERLAARGDVAIGLDVYDSEPLPRNSPLRGMSHVTLLPHIAGPTVDQYAAIRLQSLESLKCYLAGKPVPHSLRPEVYDRMT